MEKNGWDSQKDETTTTTTNLSEKRVFASPNLKTSSVSCELIASFDHLLGFVMVVENKLRKFVLVRKKINDPFIKNGFLSSDVSLNYTINEFPIGSNKVLAMALQIPIDSNERLIVLIKDTHKLMRWELLRKPEKKLSYSIMNRVETDTSVGIPILVADKFGERSVSLESGTICVRSEELKRIRLLDIPESYKGKRAPCDIIGCGFIGNKHELLYACFSNSLFMIWDVLKDAIVAEYNLMHSCSGYNATREATGSALNAGYVNEMVSMRSQPCTVVVMDESSVFYQRANSTNLMVDGIPSLRAYTLIVGFRDGKLKMFEIRLHQDHVQKDQRLATTQNIIPYDLRELAALDLHRELRFSDDIKKFSEPQKPIKGTSNGPLHTQEFSVRPVRNDSSSLGLVAHGGAIPSDTAMAAVKMKKEKVLIPIAMHVLPGFLKIGKSTPMHSLEPYRDCHLCVMTHHSLVFIDLNMEALDVRNVLHAVCDLRLVYRGFRLMDTSTRSKVKSAAASDRSTFPQIVYMANNKTSSQVGDKERSAISEGGGGRRDDDDDEEEEVEMSPIAYAEAIISSSFGTGVKLISLPLYPPKSWQVSASNDSHRSGNSEEKATVSSSKFGPSTDHRGSEAPVTLLGQNEPLSLFLTPSFAQSSSSQTLNSSSLASSNKSSLLDLEFGRSIAHSTSNSTKGSKSSSTQGARRSTYSRGDWEKPLKDKNGKLQDQPILFHNRVKSSGYGQSVRDSTLGATKGASTLLQRSRSLSAPRSGPANHVRRNKDSTIASSKTGGTRLRVYPIDSVPPSLLQQESSLKNLPPIQYISFNGEANLLGIATADSSVLTAKVPTSRYANEAILSYLGHDNRINRISFSSSKFSSTSNSGRILSSSADGTARLWKQNQTDTSVIVFSHTKKSPEEVLSVTHSSFSPPLAKANNATLVALSRSPNNNSEKSKPDLKRNRPFGSSIHCAGFYFIDKFVVLTARSSVHMYLYESRLPEASKNTLTKKILQGRYKSVHEWDFAASAHSVTSSAFVNVIQSPILLCATSDKKIQVLDAAAGKVARVAESPHDKSIHHISLPSPSVHVPYGPDQYNIFSTGACDNVIHLWDLRTPRTIARFSHHINTREPIVHQISPCLRYVATGSEDRSIRLFDIRTGNELKKLTGFKDVVSCVAFNPLFSQLAGASYDGSVLFFTDPYSIESNPVGI